MARATGSIAVVILLFCMATTTMAESVYELRKLTEEEWLDMSTEDRLRALSTFRMHERNQTFLGDFGRYNDLYSKWGYEYYEMEDRYENYAFRGYEAYNIIEERRKRWSYNEFGDRIARMRHSADIWREVYSGDGTYQVYAPYDYINSSGQNTGYVDGIWVARESTDDWAMSVTGAGALRTKLSPLTLSIPNMDGVSIDFQSENTKIKLVSSAVLGGYINYRRADPTWNDLITKGGVMLRGGSVRRKFGVLTLGANYANVYGVQGNAEGGSEWRGTVSNYTPTPIMVAVRFGDDSPEDGKAGASVYDVRLKINGRYRDDLIPQVIRDDVTRDLTSAVTDRLVNSYVIPPSSLNIGAPNYDMLYIEERIPKYVDLFYYNQSIKGYNTDNVSDVFSQQLADQYYEIINPGGRKVEANGTDTIVYLFDLAPVTEKVYRVEAETTVANDYRVESSMIYSFQGGHDKSGKPRDHYNATYWRTVAQADGNPQDESNVRTITFDFGYQVASIIYGLDADFNYRGFKVRGEWVTNDNHYMFAEGPVGSGSPGSPPSRVEGRTGARWNERDHAWYIVSEKQWEKFGFNAEIFKMGKNYKPYMDYFNYAASGQAYGINATLARNQTSRVNLIVDNDDDDMYPDTMLSQRTIGFKILSTEDPDGVFPGNDEDNDGIPDNNRNSNEIPDYDEPFLMFDIDPDEFIFGNDYNNNTIPDFREDDMKQDTPYHLDRQGYHYFFRYTPQQSINFIAGSMRTKGVGLSIRTNNDYAKFLVDYNVFDVGSLYAEYRYERIQDNFRDPYIQVNQNMNEDYLLPGITSTLSRFQRDLYYDELEYRNSKVNRLFIESNIRAIPSISFENHLRFENNNQVEGNMYDGTYQPYDELDTIAMVNKIVYSKQLGNFVFSPGLKFRFYKKARSESLQPLDHYLMRIPLVMLKYIVSDNTDIQLGMQGMPGAPLKLTDYVQSQNDYYRQSYVLQLQNRTPYFGYNVWTSIGFKFDEIDYEEKFRTFEEYKTSTLFARIYLGW